MSKQKLSSFLKLVLSIGLGIYLTWVLFDMMSPDDYLIFKRAIMESDYLLIFLSLVLALITYLSRAYRWGYTLWPMGYKSSFKNQYHSLMIGYLVNMTIPRAGEFSRALMLKRSDNIPVAASFGTVITERIIDMIIMSSLFVLSILLSPTETGVIYEDLKVTFFGTSSKTTWYNQWGIYLLVAVCLLLIIVFLNKGIRKRVADFFTSLKEGVLSIFKVKEYVPYILHTAVIWVCYLVMFALPFYAMEETANVPFSGILLAFSIGAIGISFTNGGMGAYPLLIGATTAYYLREQGIENAAAIGNALGMVIWATQTIFLILLGLISLVLMPRKYTVDE